ncbi:MAG TPA: BadF/BadG/BcrA/BcrD ATPase family protein [Actinomycetes bacterium]|nr:BadF/BadG/BcrA/BcrD ATPase family protein [Actinomycetes bacterium]
MSPTRSATSVWGIDAGGSRTTAIVIRPDGDVSVTHYGSISIGTVGTAAAAAGMTTVFESMRSGLAAGHVAFGCLGCSSAPVAGEGPYPDVLTKVIESHAPAGAVLFVNDMVPLLYAPPMSAVGIVVSSGTGSCVLGRDGSGRLVKIGGHEHVVSDEGSAYSLGRAALRAAASAIDGTGPGTILSELASEHFGMTLPRLGRWLAENRSARAAVAGFAPVVLAATEDRVARRVVKSNAAWLAKAVKIALDQLALGACPSIGFSGGVMRGSELYRSLVIEGVVRATGLHPSTFVLDGVDAVLSMARHLREQKSGRLPSVPFPGPREGLLLSIADPARRADW